MARTIKQRILEKLNEIPTEGALSSDDTMLQSWNNNLWKMMNTLPEDFLLRDSEVNVFTTNNTGLTENDNKNMTDKRILLVLKTDSDDNTRPASEITLAQSQNATDSDSMFYATDYSPVFWLESESQMGVQKQLLSV